MPGRSENEPNAGGEATARGVLRRAPLIVLAGAIAALYGLGVLALEGVLLSGAGLAVWALFVARDELFSADTASARLALEREGGDRRGAAIWRQMLSALADPVLVLDGAQHVVGANAAAHALFRALDGRHISQVHRDPELLSAVQRALDVRQSQTFDVHMVLPVERHLSGTATPLDVERGGTSEPWLLIVLRDRTEEEQLAQMRADFVANASHELRTPLASLKGFIETLQNSAKDDAAARNQFLGIMEEQASRMSRLIDDLLSLSRIEMRQHVAPTATVDLVGVIGGVTQALAKIAADAGVTIENAPMPAQALVRGDRDELVQLVQNLAQNAIKYGRRGGHVRISLETMSKHHAVAVADDGIGIAPQHLPRLTERFYRVSAKHSRERGGTGLGLAIVKHIANRHRGELRIESEPGRGSTFTILLPRAAE